MFGIIAILAGCTNTSNTKPAANTGEILDLSSTLSLCANSQSTPDMMNSQLIDMGWQPDDNAEAMQLPFKLLHWGSFAHKYFNPNPLEQQSSERLGYLLESASFMAVSILGNSALAANHQPGYVHGAHELATLGFEQGSGYCILSGPPALDDALNSLLERVPEIALLNSNSARGMDAYTYEFGDSMIISSLLDTAEIRNIYTQTTPTFMYRDTAFTLSELDEMPDVILHIQPNNWDRDEIAEPDKNIGSARQADDLLTVPAPQMTLSAEELDEIHVIAVYEGNTKTAGKIHGPQIKVHADRPGSTIALALQSYYPNTIYISVSDGTQLGAVYLAGPGARDSRVIVDEQTIKPNLLSAELSFQNSDDQEFRAMATELLDITGVKQISSFNTSDTAPVEGFTIDAMPGVELEPEPDPATFIPHNQIPERFMPFLANSPHEPAVSFTDRGFVMTTPGGKQLLPVSLDVPIIHWPVAASLDERRQRVYGVSMGDEGYLYLYDLATATWSVVESMAEADALGMLFDSSKNRLLMAVSYFEGLLIDTIDEPPQAYDGTSEFALAQWSEKSGFELLFSLDENTLPGLSAVYEEGNGPPPRLNLLAIEKDLLLIKATPEGHYPASHSDDQAVSRTYILNLSNREAALVAPIAQ